MTTKKTTRTARKLETKSAFQAVCSYEGFACGISCMLYENIFLFYIVSVRLYLDFYERMRGGEEQDDGKYSFLYTKYYILIFQGLEDTLKGFWTSNPTLGVTKSA